LTIGSKYFEREAKQEADSLQSWKQGMLLDYFAGQQVETEKNDRPDNNQPEFPIQGFDTHAISSKGVEVITKGDVLLYRTSTTAKNWKKYSLIEYFKDNIVINALPDAPDEQLPTVRLKTHAFSTDEYEIVSFKDRFWRRKEGSTDWETGSLKDYFSGATIKEGNLPYNYWDIHTFSPQGKELIISGDKVWIREVKEKIWKNRLLKDYFGKDFPLENEIQEKRKIDEEVDQKKYGLIKKKVMAELGKFFRPELINRFDEVVVFEPLKYHHMIKIVKIQLKGVSKLLEDQDIGFSYTESAVKEIVRAGFDPVFGARPLRRAIQKLIENQLSSLIIEGKIKQGDLVLVDFDGDNFVFNIEKVELVSKDRIMETKVKNYLCEKCANKFKTEVVNEASVICSRCASTQVQEVVEEKQLQDGIKPLDIEKNEKTGQDNKNHPFQEDNGDALSDVKNTLEERSQNGELEKKQLLNQSQIQGGA